MYEPHSNEALRAAGDLTTVATNLHEAIFCCGPRVRLEILAHLLCGPMTVGQLSLALQLDHTLVSKYLKALTQGGIAQMRKSKQRHIFSLAHTVGVKYLDQVMELRIPVEGGLWFTVALPRSLLDRLHPESRLSELSVGAVVVVGEPPLRALT
jgi:DNA-binding transcriptional ArsR family regulator